MPPSLGTILVLRKILKARRDYNEGKKQLTEQSVNALEVKARPLFALVFLAFTIYAWLGAIFSPTSFEQLYNSYGFYPIIAIFVISYFGFFLSSKLIVKPSAEELADDTSLFALFSACGRKELRSLISIALALIHTLVFAFYLVNKDLKWLELS